MEMRPPNYDSVIITEALPATTAFVVSDFSGPGTGPVRFQDGSSASGLSCVFVSLASTSDCFSFSTDGTNFNHTPVDGGDGTDSAITHLRISPTGYMAPDIGSGATSFTLRFKAKIN